MLPRNQALVSHNVSIRRRGRRHGIRSGTDKEEGVHDDKRPRRARLVRINDLSKLTTAERRFNMGDEKLHGDKRPGKLPPPEKSETSVHRKPWISTLGYPRYPNYPWKIRYVFYVNKIGLTTGVYRC